MKPRSKKRTTRAPFDDRTSSQPGDHLLVDRILSAEAGESTDANGAEVAMLARRRVLETSIGDIDQVDRWYASYSEEFDRKPSRRSAELDSQLDRLLEVALAE